MSQLVHRLQNIIDNEKDVIPFLKKLTDADKKELVSHLKKIKDTVFKQIRKEKIKTKSETTISYHNTHSHKQRDIVNHVCFVCCTKTEIKKIYKEDSWNLIFVIEDYIIENIIPIYMPRWYSSVVLEFDEKLKYDKAMLLHSRGYVSISNKIILNSLPAVIKDWTTENGKHKYLYLPEKLEVYPETLSDHIWLFFEEASEIHNYYDFTINGEHWWTKTILNLEKQGKLDRQQLLTATILTATKGFNRNLSGWFYNILMQLQPTKTELLAHQDALFTALQSPQSKIVNTVLKYFKTFIKSVDFNRKGFLDNSSILLNSDTKSVVNTSLTLLETIGALDESLQTDIAHCSSEALLFQDEKTQDKAAKIILKYATSTDDSLRSLVSVYSENLFHSSKKLLADFIELSDTSEGGIEDVTQSQDFLAESNKIPEYNTLDELTFFVSQVLDENQPYDKELLLVNILKLNLELSADNVDRLEPFFQRIFKEINTLYKYNPITYFLADVVFKLIKTYPDKLVKTKKYLTKCITQLTKLKKERPYDTFLNKNFKFLLRKIALKPFLKQEKHYYNTILLKCKTLLEKKSILTLLHIPTHKDCWLHPKTLIERIIAFEQENEPIDTIDIQIALGRIPMHKLYTDIDISEIQNQEIKQVLGYHFDKITIDDCSITQPELWLQSTAIKQDKKALEILKKLTKNDLKKETGNYKWECINDVSLSNEKIVFKKIKLKGLLDEPRYDATSLSIKDFLRICPNFPSPGLSYVLPNLIGNSTLEVSDKEYAMVSLRILYKIWYKKEYGEITYLYVAVSMLYSYKTTRTLAAELWIKTTSENTIDNKLLGKILGKLQHNEYGPLKRFTDLITQNLLGISKIHTKALLELLNAMLPEMNDIPIKGTKKLLELYVEIQHQTKVAKIPNPVTEKLMFWSETKSLKPISKKLLA